MAQIVDISGQNIETVTASEAGDVVTVRLGSVLLKLTPAQAAALSDELAEYCEPDEDFEDEDLLDDDEDDDDEDDE